MGLLEMKNYLRFLGSDIGELIEMLKNSTKKHSKKQRLRRKELVSRWTLEKQRNWGRTRESQRERLILLYKKARLIQLYKMR